MENNVGMIMHKIYDLRLVLQHTIERKEDLLDPEIINISNLLDEILNEYNRLR